MPKSYVSGSPTTVVRQMIERATDQFLFVSPTPDLLRATISTVHVLEDPPTIQIIASKSVLSAIRDDFNYAWNASGLVETDTLTLLQSSEEYGTSVALAGETIWGIGEVGNTAVATAVADAEIALSLRDSVDNEFDTEPFDLRTSPRTRVLETLATEFSISMRDTFETGIETLGDIKSEHIDEVHIAVLIAAVEDELHYDLGRWSEYTTFASKASVSRKKNELEEHDLITTEKVSTPVGRPRQWLKIGAELNDTDITTIVEQSAVRLGKPLS